MKEFAQILNDVVHWRFQQESQPEFAPDIEIIDVTDVVPLPQEGWIYIRETGEFIEPIFIQNNEVPELIGSELSDKLIIQAKSELDETFWYVGAYIIGTDLIPEQVGTWKILSIVDTESTGNRYVYLLARIR